ncbi:MAG: hypothetical protein NTV08_15170 [Verrucomicrobia bacterium]|nr:hypothetical protein [Verrucomicrobiota bacterium]
MFGEVPKEGFGALRREAGGVVGRGGDGVEHGEEGVVRLLRGVEVERGVELHERGVEALEAGFALGEGEEGRGAGFQVGEGVLHAPGFRFGTSGFHFCKRLSALGAAAFEDGLRAEHAADDEHGRKADGGGLVALHEQRELLPCAGIFRAGGEAVLVGEDVGLQVLDAAVAGGLVEGHGLAPAGEMTRTKARRHEGRRTLLAAVRLLRTFVREAAAAQSRRAPARGS